MDTCDALASGTRPRGRSHYSRLRSKMTFRTLVEDTQANQASAVAKRSRRPSLCPNATTLKRRKHQLANEPSVAQEAKVNEAQGNSETLQTPDLEEELTCPMCVCIRFPVTRSVTDN